MSRFRPRTRINVAGHDFVRSYVPGSRDQAFPPAKVDNYDQEFCLPAPRDALVRCGFAKKKGWLSNESQPKSKCLTEVETFQRGTAKNKPHAGRARSPTSSAIG
ncbi:hypothetical protein CHELA41_40184 [Hyphomicrobiales bacterium]|nr:hypothetical protein CHELA41_40184 [Hyphomicrobiales bacterium]